MTLLELVSGGIPVSDCVAGRRLQAPVKIGKDDDMSGLTLARLTD